MNIFKMDRNVFTAIIKKLFSGHLIQSATEILSYKKKHKECLKIVVVVGTNESKVGYGKFSNSIL